ncbi:hypothetical protein O181_028865 [Austropuccinia psidii MF-1]|uniref:Uncharacterized protein n=1 Tax=Austropuccinia psidii MF-1 TaxID=1389203 RepID=A0A9Q3CTJ0_9BASI|nr:hypothetical protein [Austropuccinia psidii MF-1]
MVHTRNGSRFSVQPDGPEKGRGNTRTKSAKSSSRKTHLEEARTAPHSPKSVSTNFDVSSEPELIEGDILRGGPLPSGSNRNISFPIQKLVQSRQRRGVGNMPKPLAGGHELLLTYQELSGSGEDHTALRRVDPIISQRQGQKDKKLAEEPKSLICRQEEGIGLDPSFERRPTGIYQLQTSSRSIQREAQRASEEEEERSQEPSGQGQRQINWNRPYPQGYRIPKLKPSAVDSVFNLARTLMEFTAKEQERINRTFSRK